jgi:hypothetical protein
MRPHRLPLAIAVVAGAVLGSAGVALATFTTSTTVSE